MTQKVAQYPILVVDADFDPISKEICEGNHYQYTTAETKHQALAIAKVLKERYEVHVYEEINANICGHWIFKKGILTHNMFNN